jgi:hypothetical protein
MIIKSELIDPAASDDHPYDFQDPLAVVDNQISLLIFSHEPGDP